MTNVRAKLAPGWYSTGFFCAPAFKSIFTEWNVMVCIFHRNCSAPEIKCLSSCEIHFCQWCIFFLCREWSKSLYVLCLKHCWKKPSHVDPYWANCLSIATEAGYWAVSSDVKRGTCLLLKHAFRRILCWLTTKDTIPSESRRVWSL